MIEIMITDDHPMVLEGLKNVLATEEDLNLAACFTDGASLVAGLKEKQPDILLLDINLPDINSIELVAKLKSAHPDMKIIALSVHNEFAVINSMLTEGASGYIQKNASGAEIITGIQTVYAGGRFLCAQSKLIMDKKTAEGLRNVPKNNTSGKRNTTGSSQRSYLNGNCRCTLYQYTYCRKSSEKSDRKI
ncbi:Transcriptional regulatory protein uhpA [Sphingobacterium spiritivorum]|uniref:Transcriptional regulatory protein uhpA n=1 Tax=Sphingobacterium spiritivorum TaxID=258 RepID=A0A380BMP6_SPHSI|nr:Transcriptional regulatory protein uhpA [Sphingobacterium spiritivorum]